jgi:branched-chain amino acid aminotransferase
VIVVAGPATPWPPTIDVVTVPWTRNERGAVAGLKTTSYAENVRALAYARERDAGEAIFLNTRGELCEATGSNVFVVREGAVRTPPGSAGCLLGVTRALVLELCAEHGIPAEEVSLAPAAPGEADEAFVTSSTREVQPIARADDCALPAAPGPTTEKIAGLFTELVARDPDP